MRITAKLAYNQIKINRQRTIWTLLGIVLSAALITAVCSFVASGNDLLVSMFGRDYAKQGGAGIALLLIPAAILSIIIISMAVVVISNAFRVSAAERKVQFGILKSVGTTKQQITATVMYESVFLSMLGIPIGIVVGLVIAFGGVQIANHFLGDINSLVHLMMNELIIVLDFVISWQAILAAFAISFFTILLSAWLPAKKAAKVSAIDSIRQVDEVKVEAKQMHTSRLTERIFGFEGTLAAKNIKRSRRNLRASIISLTVGVVLFICLGFLSGQLSKVLDYMHSFNDADVMVDYASSYETAEGTGTATPQYMITAPIDSKIAEDITGKLREYKDVSIFGHGNDMLTYTAHISDKMITSQMKKAAFSEEEASVHKIKTEIIAVDNENYKALCKKVDVPIGSTILINQYIHNDRGNAVTMEPFVFDNQYLKLAKGDGSVEEILIQGELTPGEVPKELLYPKTGMLRLIVPEGNMRAYGWQVHTDDIKGFVAFANETMGERFPDEKDSGYMEQGFTTRVYEMKDYMKVMNIAVNLVMVFVQSFVILLTLIGLTNVVSTMSANVQMRLREFAVLQSIGMTMDGVKRMIVFESIICSAKSLLIGLPLAIVLTCFINIPVRTMFPIPYEFPLVTVLCCAVAVFGVTVGTMWIASKRLQRKNIVETIRLEN